MQSQSLIILNRNYFPPPMLTAGMRERNVYGGWRTVHPAASSANVGCLLDLLPLPWERLGGGCTAWEISRIDDLKTVVQHDLGKVLDK